MYGSLTSLIPLIKRARGYRLYDITGRRYLDLWQNGGHAILGHRAFRLTTHLKNVISCGLILDLPSVYQKRLEKELARLYPHFKGYRLVASKARAEELIACYLQRQYTMAELADPVCGRRGTVCYDRPFRRWNQGLGVPDVPGTGTGAGTEDTLGPEEGDGGQVPGVIIPALPFTLGQGPWAICFRQELPPAFPEGDIISPLILAATLRSLFDLKRYQYPAWYKDDLLAANKNWHQQGLYLLPAFAADLYPGVFKKFLAQGVLLSPDFEVPSLLPGEASPGELAKLLTLFNGIPGD